LTLLGASFAPWCLHAQNRADTADSTGSPRGGTIVPLPALFYQTETGFGFGGLVTYYFRPGAADTGFVPPSELGASFIYTTKKQILAGVGTRLYLAGGSLRVAGNAALVKFPTKFWGIGNETPESAEEDYTPLTVAFAGETLYEVSRGWFVGGGLQLAHRTLREVSDTGQLVTGIVPGSADGRIIEGSLLLTRDVRDNTIYPTSGRYYQIGILGAATALGSDFGYTGVNLDFRGYLSPGRRHVLALRLVGDARSGTPPFDLLPQLGGDRLLRGYYQGRFRDKVLVAVQGEYRMPVVWRIGVVGFAAAGRVAPTVSDLGFDGVKISAGGGLRFLLSPREGLNVRADYGWGFDVKSSGFYLGIGETF
jgi:outer membrane protein assembly factor BamA